MNYYQPIIFLEETTKLLKNQVMREGNTYHQFLQLDSHINHDFQ